MSLYALCDARTLNERGVSLESFVEMAQKKDAQIIQYRNKEESIGIVKEKLLHLRSLWDKKLIINDYVELVTFCDGVHIGQDDIRKMGEDIPKNVQMLRSLIGDEKWLGLSTHNEDEVRSANLMDLDYIGLGAYRNTSTKTVDNILGGRLDAIAELSKHPVAAIGGVTVEDRFDFVTYKVIGSALYED